MQDQVTPVTGGGDVQKSQLVGTLFVVASSNFHRVARIAQCQKVNAFDDASAGDIETGDDSFGEHQAVAMPLSR